MISCGCVFVPEARVIQVYNGSSDLLPLVLEETGGLGVDIVIDSGGKNTHLLLTRLNMCTIVKSVKSDPGLLNGTSAVQPSA